MSVKNFKFVSPGVFINEIDNSFLPADVDAIGPVVVGRAFQGPAMKPTKVSSFSQFVEIFGDTVPGNGGGDVYREGNKQSPMYGTYSAKAFLNSGVAPLTYVRLLGQQSSNNDGSAGGMAGWRTSGSPKKSATVGGGSFGLFVNTYQADGLYTGSTKQLQLGAIIYVESGSVQLSGNIAGDSEYGVQASSTLVKTDSNGNFNIVIDGATNGQKKFTINFDDDSELFIRKRLNTNPQLASTAGDFFPASSFEDYWLGESFEQELRERSITQGSSGTPLVGIIAGIASGSAKTTGPHKMKGQPSQEAIAGWFIGQDLGEATAYLPQKATKLFRLIGLGHGSWLHKNIKVSIENIRQSTSTTTDYGTFSVVLRDFTDTDNAVVVMERFDNLTLDPSSPDFIARRIGDQFETWDNNERRLKLYGDYPSQSKYVRVDMNADVEAGATDATLLPFGYYGPPKFTDTANLNLSGALAAGAGLGESYVTLGTDLPGYFQHSDGKGVVISSSYAATNLPSGSNASASFAFPSVRLRNSASDGGISDQTKAYFGFQNTRTAASTRHDKSTFDPSRLLTIDLGNSDNVPSDGSTLSSGGIDGFSYIFTMDNVSASVDSFYIYTSGSRRAGTSTSGRSGNSYTTLLDAGINRFTAPFWGGFDGVDITKPDPFYNNGMSSATDENSYAFYTIKRAIDTVSDPEYIDMNVLTVPGITQTTLTQHMLNVCEERADSLAIIDLPDVYRPAHEQYYSDRSSRVPANPTNTANTLKNRRLDTSYGATFYPWVQTRDDNSGQLVWIPPSVAMLGVLGNSERQTAVWFAPAGFNRGGLSQGAAGLPVTAVTERLTSKDRDTLYESRINPIASFPSTGIVVLGQKTLQERPSALDRINVRRLVIYLKKQISIASSQVLFEQNVQATWNNFISLVDPILADVQTRFGITEYRLKLDSSTTTPDLVDQNILYAKIMVKPARAIEFIAIDFVVMSTGASFDD